MLTQWLENITAHPKTTAAGICSAALVVIPVLMAHGVTLGHAGTGTLVQLLGALATAILGAVSKDPSA